MKTLHSYHVLDSLEQTFLKKKEGSLEKLKQSTMKVSKSHCLSLEGLSLQTDHNGHLDTFLNVKLMAVVIEV